MSRSSLTSTVEARSSRQDHRPSTSSSAAGPFALETAQDDGDELPTYDALAAAEPRFGRWREWIGKRGAETRALRQQERALGGNERTGQNGWSLNGDDSTTPDDLGHRLFSSAQEQAYFNAPHVVNDDPASPVSPSKPTKLQPTLVPGPGHQPLTPLIALNSVGSRFVRLDLPFQPFCGLPLPMPTLARRASIRIGATSGSAQAIDRFLLIGTADGLHIADLVPALSSASLGDVTLEHAICKQIWTGLAVHELAFFDEPRPRDSRKSAGSSGIIVGVVSQANEERSVRLWPLQAIINLGRWRILNDNSHTLDLASASPNKAKRASALTSFRSLFSPPQSAPARAMSVTSPVDSAPAKDQAENVSMPGTLSRSEIKKLKGKGRAAPEDVDYVMVSATACPTGEHGPSLALRSSTTSVGVSRNASIASVADKRFADLPIEWASSSITLALPKGHAAITGAKLLLPPNKPEVATISRSDSEDDVRQADQPSWLYLAVSTKAVPPSRAALVYVFESRPGGERRTWALGSELYVPSAPRQVEMVRFASPPLANTSSCDKASRSLPQARSSSPKDDLSLFVATRDKAIAIILADSSVHELEVTTPAPDHRMRSTSRASDSAVKRPSLHGSKRHSALYEALENTSAESLLHSSSSSSFTSCLEIALPWLPTSSSHAYLITKGHTSYFVAAPLASNRMRPMSTVHWRSLPVRVVALCPASGIEARKLVLVAFSSTGIEVQEGIIADERYQWTVPPALRRPEEEEERDPTASYDYGLPTGFLCAGDGSAAGARRPGCLPSTCFFWSEGLGEYKLFFLSG